MNQTQKMLEEIKASGMDLATLQALAQATYGDTTPLGLRRWKAEDKPQMADFNRDNEIIDREIRALREELGSKANSVQPQEHTLSITADGVQKSRKCSCFKTQEGIVVVNVSVFSPDKLLNNGTIIATLPVGFRPTEILQTPCTLFPASGYVVGTLHIKQDGTIMLEHKQSAGIVAYVHAATHMFLAAQ